MTKQEVHVIVDVNEPPEVTEEVDSHPDVESFELDKLPAADLEIEGIGFERKTASDYVSSMKDDRLTEQCAKLGQRYDVAYVLYEGSLAETQSPFKSDMPGQAQRGHMASLTARESSGVQAVIPCSNTPLLVDMAVRLTRKHVEDSDREFIPSPDVDVDAPTALQMYACIPGVGPGLAKTLHEEWPTIDQFVHKADYHSLQQLDGIGEDRALKILEEVA